MRRTPRPAKRIEPQGASAAATGGALHQTTFALALVALFLLVRGLAGLMGDGRWALDAPWTLGPAWGLMPWLVPLLACVPAIGARLGRALSSVAASRVGAAALVTALVLVVALVPDRFKLVGDFWLRETNLSLPVRDILRIVPQMMPLDLLVHHIVGRALSQKLALGPNLAGRWIGLVDAVSAGVLAFALARELAAKPVSRLVVWFALVGSGALQFWTGFNKGQAEMPLAWMLVPWLAIRLHRTGRGFVALAIAWPAALAMHRSAVLLAPVWILGMVSKPAGDAEPVGAPRRALGWAAAIAVLAVCVPFVVRAWTSVDSDAGGGALRTIFTASVADALRHFQEVAWQAAAFAPALPAALALLAIAVLGRANGFTQRAVLFAAVPAIVAGLVFGVALGPLRDADSFVPCGSAWVLLAAGLAEWLDHAGEEVALAPAVMLAIVLMSVQPMLVASSFDQSAHRLEAYLDSRRAAQTAERARLWAFLGTRRLENGDPAAAVRDFETAATLGPSPTILRQWAIAAVWAGDLDTARRVYQLLLSRAPDDAAAWRDFGRFSVATGDSAGASAAWARLEALRSRARPASPH